MLDSLIMILFFTFLFLLLSFLYDKHIDKDKDDRFDDWQF